MKEKKLGGGKRRGQRDGLGIPLGWKMGAKKLKGRRKRGRLEGVERRVRRR